MLKLADALTYLMGLILYSLYHGELVHHGGTVSNLKETDKTRGTGRRSETELGKRISGVLDAALALRCKG